MKLYENLLNAAKENPDRIATEFMGAQFPYSMVAHEATCLAAGLVSLGIKPGQSIGCMLPNVPPFVAVHYGTLMAGCVFVPLNVMLTGPEVKFLVEDSDIRVIVVYEMFLPAVNDALAGMANPPRVFVVGANTGAFHPYHELLKQDDSFRPVDVDENLPIQTLYTSGTTGKPKGAQITNANIIANLDMFESVMPFGEDDKSLCVLPMFHVFALNGVLNACIRSRTTIQMHPRFDVDSCMRSLIEDGITTFAAVPTMYFYLLKHPRVSELRTSKLKWCVSGGAAMPVEVMTQWEKATGVPILEGFGMTETTVSVCINRPEHRKVGSIGQPFQGVDMRIFDENDKEVPNGDVGELVIKSPNIMKGYLNQPEANAEAFKEGWFHTGDMGYRDDDGFYYIVDRKKDMIIKGGFNVYPREIEEAIYQLPEVAEAAVIGVFDEVKGEHIRAVVALKPNQQLSQEAIEAHLEQRLAKYKLPNDYLFLKELPKGPTGKILKRELTQQADRWNRDRSGNVKEASGAGS